MPTINYHDHRMKELSDLQEAIGYLEVLVEEYRHDGETFGFLTGLRNVIEAQGGVKEFIRRTGIDPRDWLNVLSSNDRQDLDTLEAVFNELGDRLSGVKPEDNSLDVKYAGGCRMNDYSGSNFDDFLREEGILKEVSERARQRLLTLQCKEIIAEPLDEEGTD